MGYWCLPGITKGSQLTPLDAGGGSGQIAELRSQVLFGPLSKVNPATNLAQSIINGWPVILFATFFAAFCGWAYLHMLSMFAGLVMFATMIFGTILLVVSPTRALTKLSLSLPGPANLLFFDFFDLLENFEQIF